jgi:dethiobiotin synthetase
MSVLCVAGTDTDVGKTVVTAALAALAHARGDAVAVVKPAQTGVAPSEPGDLAEIERLSGVRDLHELARYPEPLAPATAARRAGEPGVAPERIAARVRELAATRDLVLVEGAGGLLVRFDAAGGTLADVAAQLGAPVLVVARAGLGTLNAVALTAEALAARAVACAGVVIGAWPAEPGLAEHCNLEDLPAYAGAPLIGRMPEGAGSLGRDAFLAAARTWMETPMEVQA